MEKIKIRKAGAGDLDEIMRIEKDCFPPQEAAGREWATSRRCSPLCSPLRFEA